MDRTTVKRHQQIGEQSAGDPHQGRQQADAEAIGAHREPLGHLVAELPAFAGQQQPCRRRPRHNHKDIFEQLLRRITGDHAAGDHTEHDGPRPGLQDIHIHRAAQIMSTGRTDRDRDDHGQRGANA
jgi:hypothetical protein